MCGIAGIMNLGSEKSFDPGLLAEMCRLIAHRGPDDEGFYTEDGKVALGMRRLSVIDLSGGHQPISNEDQTIWVVYNGEIYNFPELKGELTSRGHTFRTRSETEVLVHAYEEYGLSFLSRLNGMYAFALWDSCLQRLLLARDPFGIKPLYYWRDRDRGRLLFASEIKCFLADSGFPRDIDLTALNEFLTFQFVPSPGTIFKNVHKLRPGHYLLIDKSKTEILPFTESRPVSYEFTGEPDAITALREKLATAVRRQMMSDVPVGAMLSGGLDSATVVAIMQELSGQRAKTFTVGFEGGFKENELVMARRSAEILGCEHHEVVIDARDCLDVLGNATWHMDEPVATPSSLAMFWVSRLAGEHVKVVLTGQGADEPWAGYRRYRGEKLGRWYRRIPSVIRKKVVEPLVPYIPRSEALKRAVYALDSQDPLQRFLRVYTVFTPAMKRDLYRYDLEAFSCMNDSEELIRYWQADVKHLDPLAQQLYIEARLSLPDNWLTYGDKMSMASSLEARAPLLDHELMSFVESLPINLRLKGFSGHKYLFRKAISRWLPEEIMQRPKIGFTTPMDNWFQSEIAGEVRERLVSPGSACTEYFNRDYIDRLIVEHMEKRRDHTRALYCLLVFETWHEVFMKR